MAAMVNRSTGRNPVQSTDDQSTLPLIGAAKGPKEVQTPDGDWILPLISEAIDVAYLKRGNAALDMRMDASYMNRLLDADGHLSVRRLGLLDERFWRALIDQLRAHFHMDDDGERLRRALEARAACDRVIEELARKAVTK